MKTKSKTKTKNIAEKNFATIALVFKPIEGFGGGFRQEWLSGEGHGITFQLDCGAGLGSPYFTLCVTKGEDSHYFIADIQAMTQKLVSDVVDSLEAKP